MHTSTRWMVRRALCLSCALACASLGLPALAQPLPPLPPAVHSVNIVGAFGQIEREERAVPLSLAVDWVGQWGDYDYSMQATAETSGGFRPTAAVQAEIGSTGTVQHNFTSNSIIYYYARVRPRGTPPPGSYSVPFRAHARGEASGNAFADVRFNFGFPIRAESFGVNDIQSFDLSVPLTVYPSDPQSNVVYVQLRAFAQAYHNHPSYASSSQAYADPFFTFDQAAFDLEQGANTFPLADYFEFEYSEYLLNPPAPPTITVHPQDQTMCEGGAATLSADATSTAPLTYQWRLEGGALSDGDGYSGTTTPTLTIDPTVWYYSGSYDCLISNVAGDVATNPAVLVASMPVTINYPPQPVEVAAGELATFVVYTFTPGPLDYQWRKDTIEIDALANPSAATATLTLANVGPADVASYDCVVTNACGSATSDAAALVLIGTGPSIGTQPEPQSVCTDATASFTISATGTGPFTYQWSKDTLAIDTVANPSAATEVLSLSNVQAGDAGSYDCVVSNSYDSVTSNAAMLTILAENDPACTGCPACPADYDNNGGVDGGDLAQFFADFEAGEGCADVDLNGGVDGGDLAYFFTVFEAGGC